MLSRDTSPEAQALLDERYRRMSPPEKAAQLRQAWRSARALQLAGLRARFPDEDEQQLEERLAERWLGPELYGKLRASRAAERGG